MASNRTLDPQQFATTQQTLNEHCQRNRLEAAEYEALNKLFPHLRHDHAFFDALRTRLRAMDEEIGDEHPIEYADIIKDDLETFSRNPDSAPQHYQQLLALYPAYKRMATEIDADYSRISVRLNGNNSQWFKNPDCWQQRVEQIRRDAAQNAGSSPRPAFRS